VRNLIEGQRDGERGAVAILVALLLVVLLGVAALAVDIGLIAWTKTQLQTGADAAALAIAQNCAKSGRDACQTAASSKAQTLATANIAS
jgi:Flp pilus assembly protein TadG